MRTALTQARLASRHGEVPVGAVVVCEGKIVGRGRNEIVSRKDPTAHAEILAMRKAAQKLRNERLTGCVLYTTLEPCAMCAGAAVLARISEVVFGATDPRAGACGSALDLSNHKKLNHHFTVTGPVMQADCGNLLRNFFRKKRNK
jgi:tRNA(adenine34) deaminase